MNEYTEQEIAMHDDPRPLLNIEDCFPDDKPETEAAVYDPELDSSDAYYPEQDTPFGEDLDGGSDCSELD